MVLMMAATAVSAVAPAAAQDAGGDARARFQARLGGGQGARGEQGTERRENRAERRDDRRDARNERRDDQRDARIERNDDRRDARIERNDDRRDARIERRDDQRDARNERRGDWRDGRSERRDDRRDNNNDWRNDRRDTRWDRRDDRRQAQRWNRGWRSDNRYDWQRYRYQNRNAFRVGRYYAPHRHSYSRLSIGLFLGSSFYGNRYWINDPWQYRLPPAYPGTRWVRYYDDVLLVDTYNGEVIDVIYDFFW
ncbi:RcnB family protein [Allosphingosinicella flava]|uniref:RcnB family protein n=1 Tax=Allosphingosinicella flava TaxID=2771430 RepID=A0A7T2GIA4_9SPHN|nr:RcnB family protein [Sphingosinicella flava]QPQ54405.1 RcnB family protein [Sphingosinicella flava]